jgi:hypothetical protein
LIPSRSKSREGGEKKYLTGGGKKVPNWRGEKKRVRTQFTLIHASHTYTTHTSHSMHKVRKKKKEKRN